MVFFSCDGCNESLKKNKVDAHAQKCRSCVSVSCVDCSVSFWGDDYRTHTSCVSEAERYEKSIYKGPKKNDTSTNRKLTPQETWMSILDESVNDPKSNCPPTLVPYIQTILMYDNAPRKEKAFRNFASNSLKLYGREGESIISSLWKHFCVIRQKRVDEKEAAIAEAAKEKALKKSNVERNVNVDNQMMEQKECNSTIPPSSLPVSQSSSLPTSNLNNKAVSKAIKKALKKAPKHQLKIKELRKMMMKADGLFIKGCGHTVQGKEEWKKIIKDSVLNKKHLKLEGKHVILIKSDEK